MRQWLALVLIGSSGAAHAAPAGRLAIPVASRFDLTRFVARPVATHSDHVSTSRWLTVDVMPPPEPPHDPPLIRVRGKKVKFRMSF